MIGPLIDLSERAPVEPRVMRDTSLEAFESLLPTLAEREFEVLEALGRYVDRTGQPDATGGELAVFAGLSVLSVRPRLTALLKRGLVLAHATRESRVAAERRSHPVSPVLPLAAVVRAAALREKHACLASVQDIEPQKRALCQTAQAPQIRGRR